MKVILSRKGFDSRAGGDYSPWDPETGKYIVLPIPINDKELKITNPLSYEYIGLIENYLDGHPEYNLRELMDKLEIKPKIKNKLSYYAHFDPWLGSCPWLTERSNHHIGAFGQVGAAQSHLNNQEVREGSCFLFFSRFKPLKNRKWEDKDLGISYEHAKEGLYFIYGWLRVKKLVKEYGNNDTLKNHPHYTKEYFEEYPYLMKEYVENCPKKNTGNTIYLADDCGYFPKLDAELLLTANDEQQPKKNWMASRWRLPSFFHNNLTHTTDKQWIWIDNEISLVAPKGPGQEYVFPKEGNQQDAKKQQAADDWAKSLIKKFATQC